MNKIMNHVILYRSLSPFIYVCGVNGCGCERTRPPGAILAEVAICEDYW
jgi:hypothetical protein